MTDLEITKLCAEAMGYEVIDWDKPDVIARLGIWCNDPAIPGRVIIYDPMGIRGNEPFDAQAMALVKEFYLNILSDPSQVSYWEIHNPYDFDATSRNDDLNRAICECVAKMQKAKVAA